MSEKTEFLPFHAINEFMRPDFRLTIIREIFAAESNLPDELQHDLQQKIKRYIKVPGFRNSEKAPKMIKALPTSKAFEKNPELVATILSCWAESQSELRTQVFQLLKNRNWKIFHQSEEMKLENFSTDLIKDWPVLPTDFNRTKLPGFYIHWPKGEDFENLFNSFHELYPDSGMSIDKVSLMIVWLSMRLPYMVDDMLENNDQATHTDISIN